MKMKPPKVKSQTVNMQGRSKKPFEVTAKKPEPDNLPGKAGGFKPPKAGKAARVKRLAGVKL